MPSHLLSAERARAPDDPVARRGLPSCKESFVAFTSLRLHPSLLRNVEGLGFTRPTPVQSDAIPAGLAGRDILASASTGSGKTAAFLLPILHQLLARPRGATRALILTPTRELAAQIAADLAELAADTPLSGAAVYGGVAMAPQVQAFRRGTDVIVATPGRLLDHLKSTYARFDDLEHLVLDEADRMLDMGFLPDIRRILRQLPARRQTLFFSATLPAPIAGLTRELLRDPVVIRLASKSAPAAGITQAVYPVAQELKAALLVALLRRGSMREALVFTRTKHRANRLALFLERAGIDVARIHSNRSQAQRTEALAGFKRGRYQVLVATDVAARGIDVAELGHVVNFDVPAAPEDYVHRVGRTARAGATGDAFTFVAPGEEAELGRIERAVGRRIPRVMMPDFDYGARPKGRLEVPLSERLAASRRPGTRHRGRGRRVSGRV
jgi:ATP-dependent RNA helicase RhlE